MDHSTALLIVDMQQEMANVAATGRQQANPEAEERVAELAAACRMAGLPVVHVMHDDPRAESKFRRDLPSGQPLPCAVPQEGEAVFWKTTSSGFCGTGLEQHLRDAGITRLVIAGGVAAFCVNSTARSAAGLGFEVKVVEDALIAFDMPARKGGMLDAQTVLEVTLSALHAGFGKVVSVADVLAQLPAGAEA